MLTSEINEIRKCCVFVFKMGRDLRRRNRIHLSTPEMKSQINCNYNVIMTSAEKTMNFLSVFVLIVLHCMDR